MSCAEVEKTPSKRRANTRRIRHELTQISPANANSQRQSPLFSKIPPEIRNQIFTLAVSQHDDKERLNFSGYCPDYVYENTCWQYCRKTCTELLRTCRLVYYETNAIPMSSSVHFLPKGFSDFGWGSYGRHRPKVWISHFTSKNVVELDHVHCFGSPRRFHPWVRLPQFQPKQITHSVSDQEWLWNSRDPLCLYNALNLATNLMPVSLQSYSLELYICKPTATKDILDAQLAKVPDMHSITLPDGRELRISRKDTTALNTKGCLYVVNFSYNEQGSCGNRERGRKRPSQSKKLPVHSNQRNDEALYDVRHWG
jgi:hypothetical protein